MLLGNQNHVKDIKHPPPPKKKINQYLAKIAWFDLGSWNLLITTIR